MDRNDSDKNRDKNWQQVRQTGQTYQTRQKMDDDRPKRFNNRNERSNAPKATTNKSGESTYIPPHLRKQKEDEQKNTNFKNNKKTEVLKEEKKEKKSEENKTSRKKQPKKELPVVNTHVLTGAWLNVDKTILIPPEPVKKIIKNDWNSDKISNEDPENISNGSSSSSEVRVPITFIRKYKRLTNVVNHIEGDNNWAEEKEQDKWSEEANDEKKKEDERNQVENWTEEQDNWPEGANNEQEDKGNQVEDYYESWENLAREFIYLY